MMVARHEFMADSSGPAVEIPPMAADEEIADPEARVRAWQERARAAEEAFVNLLHRQAQRSDHDILIDIADLLTRQMAVLEHIRVALGQTSEDRTSVKIETGAKRELKPTVHVYAGDTDQPANTWLVEEAIRLHGLTQAYCDEGSTS
jgi:hypothetical protein